MIKRFLVFLAFLFVLSVTASAQVSFPRGSMVSPTTVAFLPLIGNSNLLYDVRDGATAATGCTVGGGSVRVVCHWTGAAYEPVGSGGTAGAVTVANEATDTTTFPIFCLSATGDCAPKTNASFTFNSNTGELGATSFVGLLTSATGLPEGGLALTDITTNNFSTTKHGFVPKGTNVGNFLKDDGTWAAAGGGLTIGTTAITSGTATRLLYETSGNVLGEISGLTSNGSTVLTQTSNSATAFESGANGATNPVFRLVNSTASQADGVSITGLAAGSGVRLNALSSGSDAPMEFTPKGTGKWNFKSGSSTVLFEITDSSNNKFLSVDQANSLFLVRNSIGDLLGSGENWQVVVGSGRNLVSPTGSFEWRVSSGGAIDTQLTRESAGVVQVGTNGANALGSLKLVNLTTTATSSTGTAAIIDASNVLRPLTSSLRFKKNVREWHPSDQAMNAFLSLNPIIWDYRDNGVKNVVGFGAESLAKVDRELINLDNEGLPYSNREQTILAYFHEILKKQQAEINALKARLNRKPKRRSH